MNPVRLITAIGTPLTDSEQLHREGLQAHLDDQHAGGIKSLLVGGTMGAMPLLTEETWRDLIVHATELSDARFELLIGVGDTGLERTRRRLAFTNGLESIDAVVVLTPYCLRFSQTELIAYYTDLADESRYPLYLYDLPALTGVSLAVETVCTLAGHSNIAGIKCSGDFSQTRRLIGALDGRMRVVVAQPEMVDVLLQAGITDQLDGIFSIAPHWVTQIAEAIEAGDTATAAEIQNRLNHIRRRMIDAGLWGAFTTIMNARGIPGRFAPRPAATLSDAARTRLLDDTVVDLLVQGNVEKVA